MKTLIALIVVAASATAAQACDALALGVGCYQQQAVVQRVYAAPLVQRQVIQYQAVPVIQQQVEYIAQPVVQKVIQKQRIVQRQKVARVKVRAPLIQRQRIVQRSVTY